MQLEFTFGGNDTTPWRPKLPERLFFSVFPDPWTARHVTQFAERCVCEKGLRGRLLRTDRLHVSLQPIGDMKRLLPWLVYGAQLAAKTVSMPPFEVTLSAMETFETAPPVDGKPPWWPTVLHGDGDGLFDVFRMLGRAMQKNGLGAASRFKPHMTLLYGPDVVLPQRVEPIRFVVREFSLIHSERGLSRYNTLGRWSLGQ